MASLVLTVPQTFYVLKIVKNDHNLPVFESQEQIRTFKKILNLTIFS